MNKSINLIMLFALLLGTTLACNKVKDSSPASTIIQEGTWKVTQYNKDGKDETSELTGYSFTFNNNGTISAAKGSTNSTGTWVGGTDNSLDKLYINFNGGGNLEKMNEDWHILEKTTTLIRLQHVSGGSGETENLTMSKN